MKLEDSIGTVTQPTSAMEIDYCILSDGDGTSAPENRTFTDDVINSVKGEIQRSISGVFRRFSRTIFRNF